MALRERRIRTHGLVTSLGKSPAARPSGRAIPSLPRRLWTWLKANGDQIKIVSAALAGVYALVEYKSQDYLNSVKISTEALEKYHGGDNYKSLTQLQAFWLSDEVAAKRMQLQSDPSGSSAFRTYVHHRISATRKDDLVKASRGLKALSICAIQGRCEATTLCMHLTKDIQDLRCNFRESIAEISAHDGSCLIDEINYFIDNYCSEWLSAYLGVTPYLSLEDNYCLYNRTSKTHHLGPFCRTSIIYKKRGRFVDRFL